MYDSAVIVRPSHWTKPVRQNNSCVMESEAVSEMGRCCDAQRRDRDIRPSLSLLPGLSAAKDVQSGPKLPQRFTDWWLPAISPNEITESRAFGVIILSLWLLRLGNVVIYRYLSSMLLLLDLLFWFRKGVICNDKNFNLNLIKTRNKCLHIVMGIVLHTYCITNDLCIFTANL